MKPIYKILEMVLAGPAFAYTCHAVEDLEKCGEITGKEKKAALKFIENEVEAYCKKIGKPGEYRALINCFRSDPKYSYCEGQLENTSDSFYVQVRKEWLESKIAKLKKNIRTKKTKVSFKVGDRVRITKASEWIGFVSSMHQFIGTTGKIVLVAPACSIDPTCYQLEGADPYGFLWPQECLELIK